MEASRILIYFAAIILTNILIKKKIDNYYKKEKQKIENFEDTKTKNLSYLSEISCYPFLAYILFFEKNDTIKILCIFLNIINHIIVDQYLDKISMKLNEYEFEEIKNYYLTWLTNHGTNQFHWKKIGNLMLEIKKNNTEQKFYVLFPERKKRYTTSKETIERENIKRNFIESIRKCATNNNKKGVAKKIKKIWKNI